MTTVIKPNYGALAGGILCSLSYLYLAINSKSYGSLGLTQLLSCTLLCALASFMVWWLHWRKKEQITLTTLLGFAILFRVIGVFTFPILEDDFYRYLWDARMTLEHGSPYGVAPEVYFDFDLDARFEVILGSINYPSVATVYGPSCQWVFALGYLIAPGEVWPLQVIFGLVDIALIMVLLKLASPNNVLLYAWSPLIIKEFVITAHPDVLGALCLTTALLCYRQGRYSRVGILIALAAGVKVFAILLLPFLLGFNWRGWLSFLLTATLISLPFGVVEAWAPDGLRSMGADWLFNAPLYALLSNWLTITSIKWGLLAALACGCASYLLHSLRNWPLKHPRFDLLFAALLLCLPALNPWYLVWLLPFCVARPNIWAWVASWTIMLSYASGINLPQSSLQPYQHPSWVLIVEFGAILVIASVGFIIKITKTTTN